MELNFKIKEKSEKYLELRKLIYQILKKKAFLIKEMRNGNLQI